MAEGRTHLTQFSIDSSGGGNNYGKTEVLDREPTTAAAFTRLSRLLPGYEYKLSMSSDGFNISDEDVLVAVDLLELDSTVAKVTRNVLRDAESDLGINAINYLWHIRGILHTFLRRQFHRTGARGRYYTLP